MSFGRNLARLLRNPDLDSGWGELLAFVNWGTAIIAGVALGVWVRSGGLAIAAVFALGIGLFVALANRATFVLAAVMCTVALGAAVGAIGLFLFSGLGAVIGGGGAAAAVAGIYRSVWRSLQQQNEDADWY